jgi:hypothetical protein
LWESSPPTEALVMPAELAGVVESVLDDLCFVQP